MNYSLTVFDSIFDNKTDKKVTVASWEDFEKLMFQLSKLPGYKAKKGEKKKSSSLISPAIYTEGATRANANVTGNANLATVRTNAITTGSNTTPGNLTGVWSLNGTLTSNGNITALGFESDNYRYANGQLINFDAAAGNTGEIQFNTGGS